MTGTQKRIEEILSGCERQTASWRKLKPAEFPISESYPIEKYGILTVTLGYIGRHLELYDDTRCALDEDRILSGVILARASVECAAMLCLFHEQMKKHFWPKPSDNCIFIIDRHRNAGRLKTGDEILDKIKSFHIIDAIKSSNKFAQRINDQTKQKHFPNVVEIMPALEASDFDPLEEYGIFGWIYDMLSEYSHPNPIGQFRYFKGSDDIVDFSHDDLMKDLISEGLRTMYYSGVAANALLKVCGVTPVRK